MKLKLSQMELANIALGELTKVRLDSTTSFALTDFVLDVFKPKYVADTQERQKIYIEYAKKDDKGNPIINAKGNFDIEDQKAFDEEMTKYGNIEIELPFKVIERSTLNGRDITPNVLIALTDLGFVKK